MSEETYDQTSTSGMKRGVLVGLFGLSFFVFVAGSFVVAYIFLTTASAAGGSSASLPELPKIGGLPSFGLPSLGGDKGPSAVDSNKRINILLLGLDQRDDEKGAPTRSDSMIAVSIDPASKTVAMISFPRDMWVEIPGYAPNRINVANFLGDAYHYDGGGPALAEKTVEQNFGIHFDYYVRIGFRGLEKVVDTLNGIDVNVETAIRDDEYPTEDYGIMSIYIPTGMQHMNGKVALQYARSRHSDSDFGRAKRQQKVLLGIKEKALALDVIPKIPTLVGNFTDMIDTDIPLTEMIRLATLAKEIDSSKISQLVIDEKLAPPFTGEGGANLLMPNKPEIKKAIAALMGDPAVRAEAAKIEVINGTATQGLATKTKEYLVTQGFEIFKVSSAERSDYPTTQVLLVNESKKATANALASALKAGAPTVVPATAVPAGASTDTNPDIRIVLGLDFKLPQ